MFRCKVCDEKNQRIAELKDQIAHLRTLVYPVTDLSVNHTDAFEEDVVTLPSAPPSTVEEEHNRQMQEVIAERDRLLSGTYE